MLVYVHACVQNLLRRRSESSMALPKALPKVYSFIDNGVVRMFDAQAQCIVDCNSNKKLAKFTSARHFRFRRSELLKHSLIRSYG